MCVCVCVCVCAGVGVGVCIYKCKFTMNRIVRLSILGTEKARASKHFQHPLLTKICNVSVQIFQEMP